MKVANIHEAKTTLSKLIECALAAEEVIISKAGKPMVRLVMYEPNQEPRQPGLWEGQVIMADDFDDPLPEEVLRGFLGESE
ncbi:MAG: type II toxin-antitoxin system Phd/YefM family antitoxin [Thermosynechococcaceae cyanobacterium]